MRSWVAWQISILGKWSELNIYIHFVHIYIYLLLYIYIQFTSHVWHICVCLLSTESVLPFVYSVTMHGMCLVVRSVAWMMTLWWSVSHWRRVRRLPWRRWVGWSRRSCWHAGESRLVMMLVRNCFYDCKNRFNFFCFIFILSSYQYVVFF